MSGARLKRIADWTVRLGLPLAVLATVIAVFFGEQMGIDHELSLVTPVRAERGAPLPIRAVVLTDLGAMTGPRIASLPVDVSLQSNDGSVILERRFEASPAGGADGVLTIPSDAPERVVLRAVARIDGRGVASASRTFELSEAPPAAELAGRSAHATQHFQEGPLTIVEGQTPPAMLTTRVVGGACVPETPCEVLVHVGAPAALVRVPDVAAIDVDHSPEAPTAGLARVVLTVHGPEAHVTLEATRGGVLVASRPVTLPVALATPGLRLEDRVGLPSGGGPTLRADVLGDRPGVIVDAWAEGRWVATGSVVPSDEPFAAPLTLGDGLHRIQVHTDPFSSARAATRVIAVGDVTLDAALRALESRAGETVETPDGPDELRFAWAAAGVELGHYELPPPVRGYEQDHERLESRQRVLRGAALGAMMLGLLVLVLIFVRRGVEAALEAQRVMDATGDPDLVSKRHRRKTLLSALTIVATMLLAFLAAGAMIVARARLLE